MEYKIFIDASADVDAGLIKDAGITMVPMQYMIEGVSYIATGTDSREDMQKFYDLLKEGKQASTSQITPYMYEEIMSPTLEAGYSIIYLCLSSGLSSTYESAKLAQTILKEKYPNVDFVPVDSLQATAGMGVLAERMFRNRNKCLSIFENKADIDKFVSTLNTFAYVSDLMHLKRGGRLSAVSAAVGSMLHIKPIIKITPIGKLEVCDKKRGAKNAIQALADEYQLTADYYSVVYVSDSCNEELADYLANKLKERNPNVVIKRCALSVIIGSHLGPEALAISYSKKPM